MTTSMGQAETSFTRMVHAAGMRALTIVGSLSLILFSVSAHAQYSSGVDGTVQDSSGAIVPGVAIQLTNVDLGVTQNTKSNDAGYFRIDSIAAGKYKLQVSAASFKVWEVEFALEVGQIRTLAPKLEPGAVDTTVTVSATEATVDLTTASTSAVIGTSTVEQVPLVGQNVYALAAIAPGMTGPGLTSGDNYNNQYGIQINAAGQRQESNSFMIDGAFVDTPSLGGEASVSPNPEIVQSIQVNTNEFDASKGRTSGAAVNLFTNSGSNTFHGTGDYFFLNQSLTARTEFESTVPAYTRQEMGGTIGGPILKDRLFFYGGIDVLRSSVLSSGVTTVETQDFNTYVQSNFKNIASELLKIFPPLKYPTANTLTVAQVETQFPGYFAPPANIPASLDAIGPLDFSYSTPRNGYQWDVRIDEYLGEHDRIYGTALRTTVTGSYNGVRPAGPYTEPSTFLNIGWTHTFSPHLLNEAGISFVRPGYSSHEPSVVGTTQFPGMTVNGIDGFGPSLGLWVQNTIGWRDMLSWSVKSHTLKTGFYVEDIRENDTIASDEYYSFNSILDFIQDEPVTEQGVSINLTNDTPVTPLENYRQPYYGIFLQDDWKVKRNLTINAGVRYDSEGNLVEIINPPLSEFVFGTGSGEEAQIANGSVALPPGNSKNAVSKNVWAFNPRVGFSWDIFGNGSTALRGGFGLFSDRMPYRGITGFVTGNLPVTYTPSLSVYSDQTPAMNTCTLQGYNYNCPLLIPSNIQFDSHGGIVGQRAALGGYSPNQDMPQVENWTLSIQRQLTPTLVAEINYSGMASHHLEIYTDINRFPGDLIQNKGHLERLNQSFGAITYQTTNGNAAGNYGSAMVTRQLAHGWTLRGIYTFGKALDEFSNADTLQGACACESTNVFQAQNIPAQRGRADFDIRQQASIDGVWTLPNPWAPGWKRDTLGGWRLGGVAVFETGLPFSVYTTAPFVPVFDSNGNVTGNTGGDFNADGYDYDAPSVPSFGSHLGGQSRRKFLTGLFPASAFPSPALGQEGNLGRNTYDQPGYKNANFNAEKLFYAPWFHGEKLDLEFRAEMVNTFNRPNLTNVDGDSVDATFGQATGTLPARTIQFHLRGRF